MVGAAVVGAAVVGAAVVGAAVVEAAIVGDAVVGSSRGYDASCVNCSHLSPWFQIALRRLGTDNPDNAGTRRAARC